MAQTIKTLIKKNKLAFDSKFYIESLSLSYILINKALKQVVKDHFKIALNDHKLKTSDLISQIKKEFIKNPGVKIRITKTAVRDIEYFLKLYKSLYKELKYQYPEKKIEDTANLGISCLVILNTSLIKIKNSAFN
ncbi:MAG: hypothetical protein ACK504_08270 [Bacteroidota bacterium]|jgi:hypothetical protein